MAGTTSTPPTLSVTLSINPTSFHAGAGSSPEPPTINVTATSHADQAITFFTWPTIFNLDLSQKRSNFTCLDLTSNEPLRLELTKGPQRSGFTREAGGPDDTYFQTLEPGKAVTFRAPFKLASRMTEGSNAIVPGHRYRFAVSEGETIPWWRYGRKPDVMAPAGQHAELGQASGPPIAVTDIAAVEFEVLER